MQKFQDSVISTSGAALAGATVVVTTSTGAQATLYAGNGVDPISGNVLTTDLAGRYGAFAANGRYTFTVSAAGHATYSRDVLLFDPRDDQGLYVTEFGAVGDGVHDDTAAINAAIAAAISSGIKRVLLPGTPTGTGYRITSTIEITTQGVTLEGDGGGGNAQAQAGSFGVVGRGSLNDSSGTRLLGDFTGGPMISIRAQGCTVRGMTIARTDAAYQATHTVTDEGIRVYALDVSGGTTRRTIIENLRVTNQAGPGIVMCNDIVLSEIRNVEINYVRGHGLIVAGGEYYSRVSTHTRPGQLKLTQVVIARTGGHSMLVGRPSPAGSSAIPYRIECENVECFYNLIDHSLASESDKLANGAIYGENCYMGTTAFDGRHEFVSSGNNGDPKHASLLVAGRIIKIDNHRSVQTTSPSVYVANSMVGLLSTRAVEFRGLAIMNSINGSAGYFNPAVWQDDLCRQVYVEATVNNQSYVTTLLNKPRNSLWYEDYYGNINDGRKHVEDEGSAETVTYLYGSAFKFNRRGISLDDDGCAEIVFDGATWGIVQIAGNVAGAQAAVLHFRAGADDGNAHVTVLAATANVTVGVGPLTVGTSDGVDARLNVHVDNTAGAYKLFIKNRVGVARTFNVAFLAASSNSPGVGEWEQPVVLT
jgi:hypothetical protein